MSREILQTTLTYGFRFALPLISLTLAGCAQPDLRSAIYSFNSVLSDVKYAQMHPALGVPAAGGTAYRNNQFLFIPGALIVPAISPPDDDQRRRAAVWRIHYAREYCNPSSSIYRLQDVEARKLPDVFIDYSLDSNNFFIPQQSDRHDVVKKELALGDKRPFAAAPLTHGQPLFLVKPVELLVVEADALASQQRTETTVAEPSALRRKLLQLDPQCAVIRPG